MSQKRGFLHSLVPALDSPAATRKHTFSSLMVVFADLFAIRSQQIPVEKSDDQGVGRKFKLKFTNHLFLLLPNLISLKYSSKILRILKQWASESENLQKTNF